MMTPLHSAHPSRLLARIALWLALGAFAANAATAAEATPRPFDLPADNAAKTLRLFSEQAGVPVVFGTDTAAQVRTNAVKGTLPPMVALTQMLVDTGLVVAANEKTGALMVSRSPNAPGVAQSVSRDRPLPSQNSPSSAPATPGAPLTTSPSGETVVLSPFEVTSEADTGYRATNSLAGSRLNTNLGDIPSQLTVLTPDLLRDLGVDGIEDAMIYMANVESIREFAEANVQSAGTQFTDASSTTRIRGLEGLTSLMGMFPTYVPTDSFNSERFTLASGPNAILFGLGNAGGVIDNTPKRAHFIRRNELRLQVDKFDGRRATLDTNLPLIPKLAAVRLSGLVEDKGHFRRPFRDENRRLYSAITLRPFANTNLSLNGEWTRRDAQRTPLQLPRDYATGWINAGRLPFDNSGTAALNAALITARAGANAYQFAANNNAAPVYVYGNTSALPVQSYAGTVTTVQPANYPGVLALDQISHGLNRPDLFPREVSPLGLTAPNRVFARVFQASLDQRLASRLFLNLGYSHEDYFEKTGGYSSYGGVDSALTVKADAARYLPDRATLNPNFGKLYLEDRKSTL